MDILSKYKGIDSETETALIPWREYFTKKKKIGAEETENYFKSQLQFNRQGHR